MSETGIEAVPVPDPKCPLCGAPLPPVALPLSKLACPGCGKEVMMPGKVGAYRLERLIGVGGMGAVYEGVDEGLGRRVAVKVILREKAESDPAFLENFRREAQSAAKLSNPNIVGVYAFGESDGQPYLVMELVEPDALDRMMEAGPVAPATVMDIGRQIAKGLKAADEQGLVHGDVKPENILINAAREAKLADFGIAALAGSGSSGNEVWGTPYYIAPETLRRQKPDGRSDIYSLGATLYHALAGVPPFEGADAVEVMKARLVGPARPIRNVAPSCPEPIAKIIMRMLESEPSRRYPNYDSLLADIAKVAPEGKGHGKRIMIKGGKSPTVSMPSRPMPSVAQVNAPLFPEKPGVGKGKIVGIAVGAACGLVALIGILVAVIVSANKKEPGVAPAAQAANPAAAQAAADLKALAALSERVASRSTSAAAQAKKAEDIVKWLESRAKVAVLPAQEAWLSETQEAAPTAMLRQLQEAFAKRTAVANAAKKAEALRTQVDGLRVGAGEAEGNPSEALAQAQAAVEAQGKDAEVAAAEANLRALQSLQAQWPKTVAHARKEMEAAVEAQRAAEKKAREEARAAEAAQKAAEAAAEELASVATMEASVGADLDRFQPEAAEAAFKKKSEHLQSPGAKQAAAVSAERLAAYTAFKKWLIAQANKGNLAAQTVTKADANAITVNKAPVTWVSFVSDKQVLAVRIIQARIGDDAGARQLSASERADLAVSARLFLRRYVGDEMIQKSASVQALMEKLRELADALPASRAKRQRLEGEAGEAAAE